MKKTPFYMRVPRNVGKHGDLIARRARQKRSGALPWLPGKTTLQAREAGSTLCVRCWNLATARFGKRCEAVCET
jgi:hypothetical protein